MIIFFKSLHIALHFHFYWCHSLYFKFVLGKIMSCDFKLNL